MKYIPPLTLQVYALIRMWMAGFELKTLDSSEVCPGTGWHEKHWPLKNTNPEPLFMDMCGHLGCMSRLCGYPLQSPPGCPVYLGMYKHPSNTELLQKTGAR